MTTEASFVNTLALVQGIIGNHAGWLGTGREKIR
jgi:hypothetical protein